jgi:hypothetical protein
MPPRHGGDVLRQGPHRLGELLIGRSGDHRDNGRLQSEIIHLPADEHQVVDIARRVHPIRPGRAHLGDRSRMVHGAGGIAFRQHYFEAFRLDRLLELLGDRERKKVVACQNRDTLDILVLSSDKFGDRHGDGIVAGQRREDVPESLVEDFRGRRRRCQQRNLIFFRHGAGSLGCARAEWGEHELHLVLRDHPLDGLHGTRRVGSIVGIDDLDPVRLPVGPDSTFGVCRVGPQVIDTLLFQPLRRERPGQRQRRTNFDQILCVFGFGVEHDCRPKHDDGHRGNAGDTKGLHPSTPCS